MARRVLVVDDSAVIRDLIRLNLELEGLVIEECADGVEALEAIARQVPDAITLDVRMPRMDGFEVLEHLRADAALEQLPVVLVTGRASAADLVRGRALGVDAYLVKPFEPAELMQAVLRLLEGRHPA